MQCRINGYIIDPVLNARIPNNRPPGMDEMISPVGMPMCHKHDGITWMQSAMESPTYFLNPNNINPLNINSHDV